MVNTPIALPLGPAFNAKAREWAIATIAQLAASGDSLTRLKNLKTDESAYEALLQACLLIAWRKSTAYRRAYSGTVQEQRSLTGWLLRDPELARATELFTRSRLAVNELEMLPTAFHPVVVG